MALAFVLAVDGFQIHHQQQVDRFEVFVVGVNDKRSAATVSEELWVLDVNMPPVRQMDAERAKRLSVQQITKLFNGHVLIATRQPGDHKATSHPPFFLRAPASSRLWTLSRPLTSAGDT